MSRWSPYESPKRYIRSWFQPRKRNRLDNLFRSIQTLFAKNINSEVPFCNPKWIGFVLMTLNLNRKTLFLLLLQIQCLLHYTCLRISAIQLYTKQLLKPNFSKWGITTSRYEIKYRTAKTNSNGSRNILDPVRSEMIADIRTSFDKQFHLRKQQKEFF